MTTGLLIVTLGVLVIAQVTRGQALERLGVLPSTSSGSS